MKTKNAFVSIHTHTQFSLRDGAIKIPALVQRVKNLGMTACSITDHGNLRGIIDFYKECKKEGIRPLLGSEAYITIDPDDSENRIRDNYHMILIAQNETGLRNLTWLTNRAHLHNFYHKPRIWIGHLRERSEGLIATTACLGGVLAKGVAFGREVSPWDKETSSFNDPHRSGDKWLAKLSEYFPGRFYVEIQDHPNWEQEAFNAWAIRLARSMGLPLVLTSDAHYLRKEDRDLHDLVMAQQYSLTLAEHKEKKLSEELNCWIREPEEMYRAAEKLNVTDAFWNTREIADSCDVEIELGEYELPNFDITTCDDYQDFLKWKENGLENP
jgi:DNA polymerase-3 subunit alpha